MAQPTSCSQLRYWIKLHMIMLMMMMIMMITKRTTNTTSYHFCMNTTHTPLRKCINNNNMTWKTHVYSFFLFLINSRSRTSLSLHYTYNNMLASQRPYNLFKISVSGFFIMYFFLKHCSTARKMFYWSVLVSLIKIADLSGYRLFVFFFCIWILNIVFVHKKKW